MSLCTVKLCSQTLGICVVHCVSEKCEESLPISTAVNFFISANYAKRNVVIIYCGNTMAFTFNSQQVRTVLLHLFSSYLLPSNCITPPESHKLFVASVVRMLQLMFAFSHIILQCWQSEENEAYSAAWSHLERGLPHKEHKLYGKCQRPCKVKQILAVTRQCFKLFYGHSCCTLVSRLVHYWCF